uniref:Fe2OG dioxygenase domain-containing protein n=1 Tax=viral metagenome TaxID=1070528 RepID=A0A6C0LQ16_9ZZZZ
MDNYFAIEPDFTEQLNHLIVKHHHGYLLNVDKEYFDILEKFVFDTALFHVNHHHTEDSSNNINDYFIEFWMKNTPLVNNIHIDCDEGEREINKNLVYPTKSIITYLNDHLYPTLFTNIDAENYKYKSFEKENNIKLIFPKKNTQVAFDGSKYHGEIKLNEISDADNNAERCVLAINIWKHKPRNREFYESSVNSTNEMYNKTTSLINIVDNCDKHMISADKQFSEPLIDKLLFKDDVTICLLFKDEIQNCLTKNIYYIDIQDNSIYNDKQPNLQNERIVKDIENISSDTIQYNNRFLQRFVYNNFFSREICEWIIFEANELGDAKGWNIFRHNYHPTIDIPLQIINPVFKFCAFAFRNLFKQIFKSYCIPEKYTANIRDMFIVKYEVAAQKSLNIHKDGTHLSFNIMLSDINDYEGGGTYFDDRLTYYLNRGDALVHSGYINHGSHDITKGTRYVLVVFFNIVEQST